MNTENRRNAPARELAYVGLAVALITVCAWISIPIGTIAVTLQTFAVCFIGAFLGWKRGIAAVAIYVFMGLIGIPVFSQFKAGAAAIFGATGGYILGFFFLVLVPALLKCIPVRNKWARTCMLCAGMVAGISVCYVFGTVWFMVVYECTFLHALSLCVVPYLIPDAVKLFLAAILAVRLERYIN
ncbi:MAG: biotin transporter BioY [Clostridia bacterium]|nr:biotin transporter BioY [Clostridia bacterium]